MASLMMPMLSFVAGLFVWGAELATRIVMFQFANAAKVSCVSGEMQQQEQQQFGS